MRQHVKCVLAMQCRLPCFTMHGVSAVRVATSALSATALHQQTCVKHAGMLAAHTKQYAAHVVQMHCILRLCYVEPHVCPCLQNDTPRECETCSSEHAEDCCKSVTSPIAAKPAKIAQASKECTKAAAAVPLVHVGSFITISAA